MITNCLSEAFTMFLDRDISPFTRSKYYYRLRPFIALHSDKRPSDITTAMLADFIAARPNLADSSRAMLRSCLHALLSFCEVEPNPAKALPRWRETPRRVIIRQEL